MEQVLTDEQLISLLDVLEEGDKSFTQASYRDLIMTAHTDMLFELGIRDVAAMEAGWKAFGQLQTKFHGEILSTYGKFQAGTLSTAAATTKFKNLLRSYGKDAFMSGTEMVGNSYYKTVGMTKKDAAFINKYVRTETRHWRKFLGDIKDPKHLPANKIPRDKSGRLLKGYRRQVHPYRQRLGYYADSLRGMGFNGMVAGAGTLLNIFWVLDKLTGRRTDHCNDCVRIAAGNPYSWQTLPTTPRAGDTECKYRCYCGLEFQQRKGRGKEFDIPGSGSVQGLQAPNRWARIFDKFGRPISGAPLQDVEDIYQRMYKARQMIEITKAQEKLGWIRARQQLNNVLINQYPQYRKIPLVSVKDLTKAVTAAQPARGDLLKNLANISSGTEVTFLRGNYFANGKLFLERGQWVFKDATGVQLVANLETDVVFQLAKKGESLLFKPAPGASTAGQKYANATDVQKTALRNVFGENWEQLSLDELVKRYTPKGFTLKSVSLDLGKEGLYISADIHKGYNNIGSFRRSLFDSKQAYHNEIWLNPQWRGQGIAKKQFKQLIGLYDELGITEINCTANGEQGKYAWAKFGYDFKFDHDLMQMEHHFKGMASATKAITIADYKIVKLQIESLKHSWEFATYTYKGVHYGKEWMLGTKGLSWQGVLDLTKGSASRTILEGYLEGV